MLSRKNSTTVSRIYGTIKKDRRAGCRRPCRRRTAPQDRQEHQHPGGRVGEQVGVDEHHSEQRTGGRAVEEKQREHEQDDLAGSLSMMVSMDSFIRTVPEAGDQEQDWQAEKREYRVDIERHDPGVLIAGGRG